MLGEYLTAEQIRLQIAAPDWRAAVRSAGELLELAGVCEPRYVEAMIAAVERLGPYMVLAPGIALAHARPEDGVLKPGLSIVTLATPVAFGSPENDPVRLVIAFGGVDHTSHIGMLQELALFLMQESNQELLKSASDIQSLMTALNTPGGES
jgi:PTS system ascorbate-specific IIA component